MGRCEGVEIYGTSDPKWNEVLSMLPAIKRDIYYTSEYHALYEDMLGSVAELFVYKEGDRIGVYPYLKTEIKREYLDVPYFDIETVYGYGGPVTSDSDTEFNKRFEDEFLTYCSDNNIVAEFIRFHPLIRNEGVFTNLNVLHNRITVSVDLTKDEDEIWSGQLSSGNRNVIRKCIKTGLYVEATDDYQPFYEIYKETMSRVGADSFYFFDEDMIRTMCVDENYEFLVCKKEEEILAAAIFMKYGQFFHYHLSGSHREAMKYNPNNLLLWEAIRKGKEAGCSVMHLGGGLSDSQDDNLFKFKAHFSKNYNDFYIGKRVHNKEIYDLLISEWEKRSGRKAKILLQYKEPV